MGETISKHVCDHSCRDGKQVMNLIVVLTKALHLLSPRICPSALLTCGGTYKDYSYLVDANKKGFVYDTYEGSLVLGQW